MKIFALAGKGACLSWVKPGGDKHENQHKPLLKLMKSWSCQINFILNKNREKTWMILSFFPKWRQLHYACISASSHLCRLLSEAIRPRTSWCPKEELELWGCPASPLNDLSRSGQKSALAVQPSRHFRAVHALHLQTGLNLVNKQWKKMTSSSW